MLKGFKEFIMRGNVVDMAVGIVIGVAFGAVVTSFVDDILMALIGAIVGKPNFNSLVLGIGDGEIAYGKFLTALVSFLIIAAAIYFAVIMPLNMLAERRKRGQEDDVEPTNEEKMVALLEEIAASSKR
ncbi:MAG: large conductance mechanosensitive channel protein MscL [Microthrixaceae bacterium]